MERILIIKLSALGDIIHTLPVLKALKMHTPNTFVGWLVSRSYMEILECNPYIDQIFIFERERWRGLKNCLKRQHEIWNLIQNIRSFRFDTVLDFQGLLRSGFFTLFSGARRRIGFANARELAYLAYNEPVNLPTHIIHAVDRYAYLAEKVTRTPVLREFPIFITEREREKAAVWLNGFPSVVIVPGARWKSKCWPPHFFSCLIDGLILAYQARVVIVGARSDISLGNTIIENTRFPDRSINLAGKTSLKELAALMEKADLVVSNDSGPMHIAAAVGTRVIGLFGPTDSKKTGPYGTQHKVLQAEVSCTPCRNRICNQKSFCMDRILPEQVLSCISTIFQESR